MSYTPTKPAAYALHVTRNAIAASALFQEITGAASEEDAKAFVLAGEADDSQRDGDYSNRAIVDLAEGYSRELIATGTRQDQGSIEVAFEFIVPAEYTGSDVDSRNWMLDQAETILEQMATKGDTGGGYIAFRRATHIGTAFLSATKGNEVTDQDIWGSLWSLEYP